MTNSIAEISQGTAARLAGFMHLLAMPTASFSVYYVWPRINVPNDAAQTGSNIIASEQLFRLGILRGLGSTVFSYLFFKSRYIPRVLGVWGIFSSLVLLAGTLAFIVFPTWRAILTPGYFAPIFIYELTLGFWLLIKGARIQSNSPQPGERIA